MIVCPATVSANYLRPPSNFAFPSNAVKSEATANVEMILIADVDLKLLDQLHA